jgi:hypothetical protein
MGRHLQEVAVYGSQRALCSAAHRNPSCTSLSRYKRTHSLSGPAEVQRLGNHTPVSTRIYRNGGTPRTQQPTRTKDCAEPSGIHGMLCQAQTRSDKVCKYLQYRHQGTQTTTVLNLAVSCHALPGPNKVRQHQKSGTPYRRHPGPDVECLTTVRRLSLPASGIFQLRQHYRL